MTGCGNTRNLNEVASAPVWSCSGARTIKSKFFWRILAGHSSPAKMTACVQFRRARLLREKICLHALRLNLRKRSVSAPKVFWTGSRLGGSSKKGAKLCMPGRSKAICRNHSSRNQIYSKWNGRYVPESARCFQRSIRRAFFLKKLRDANSSRRRCRFLTVYATRPKADQPGDTDPLYPQRTM